MFTNNQYQLNQEYRNRQEANAQRQQFANQFTGNKSIMKLSLRHRKTVISVLVTIALWVVISLTAGQASAQDAVAFSNGDSGESKSGGLEVLYLVSGVNDLRAGDFEQARLNFDASIETNPEYDAAYAARAFFYLIQQDVDNAFVDAHTGYAIDPESPEIHFMLGAVYYEMGQFEDSRSHYETYLALVETAESEPPLMFALFGGQSVALAEAQIASSTEYLVAVGG